MVVISDDFDFAAVHAAMGIDVVSGHDGGPGQRSARHRGFLTDHADLDRVGGLRGSGEGRKRQREAGTSEKP